MSASIRSTAAFVSPRIYTNRYCFWNWDGVGVAIKSRTAKNKCPAVIRFIVLNKLMEPLTFIPSTAADLQRIRPQPLDLQSESHLQVDHLKLSLH